MEMRTATSQVKNDGSLDQAVATVELNPVLAHVLSRDLYTRPVEAALREVLINAIDAHIEAGQRKPVRLTLPTWSNPVFEVKDFGRGMSHEDMMRIYLDYGKSTRRGDNERHGGLGLGTKAPLAYADAFTVISCYEGTRREYLVFYNEDGIPTRDLRSVEETDDTGLTVRFALKQPEDVGDFQRAAKAVLPWLPKDAYKLSVKLQGSTRDELNLSMIGDTMGRRPGNGVEVVMGYQRYDVDRDQLLAILNKESFATSVGGATLHLATAIKKLSSGTKLTLFAKIGEIQVHPSRESVVVTKRGALKIAELVAEGIKTMFSDLSGLDFDRDVTAARVLGRYENSWRELKVRAKTVAETAWTLSGWAGVGEQISSYYDLIQRFANSDESVSFYSELSQTDWTDYVGKSARQRRTPPNCGSGLVVFDVDTTDPRVIGAVALSSYKFVDIEDQVDEFRREETAAIQSVYRSYRRQRMVTRSMQDPSHNMLVLKTPEKLRAPNHYEGEMVSWGAKKAHWMSDKLSVADLEEKNVFWIETRMGVSSQKEELAWVTYWLVQLRPLIPEKEFPVIIGLPASKGTKRFERAFPHFDEIYKWIDQVLARPGAVRQMSTGWLTELLNAYGVDLQNTGEAKRSDELALTSKYHRTVTDYRKLLQAQNQRWAGPRHLTFLPDELRSNVDMEFLTTAVNEIFEAIVKCPEISEGFVRAQSSDLPHRSARSYTFLGRELPGHKAWMDARKAWLTKCNAI